MVIARVRLFCAQSFKFFYVKLKGIFKAYISSKLDSAEHFGGT